MPPTYLLVSLVTMGTLHSAMWWWHPIPSQGLRKWKRMSWMQHGMSLSWCTQCEIMMTDNLGTFFFPFILNCLLVITSLLAPGCLFLILVSGHSRFSSNKTEAFFLKQCIVLYSWESSSWQVFACAINIHLTDLDSWWFLLSSVMWSHLATIAMCDLCAIKWAIIYSHNVNIITNSVRYIEWKYRHENAMLDLNVT